MDIPDAISSDDHGVAIPDHLRELLRTTAERKLAEVCDVAFPHVMRERVIVAVHVIDAFERDAVTADVALDLIPAAIEWAEPVEMPHTLEAVAHYERQLALARELIELRDRLGGSPPESPTSSGIGGTR